MQTYPHSLWNTYVTIIESIEAIGTINFKLLGGPPKRGRVTLQHKIMDFLKRKNTDPNAYVSKEISSLIAKDKSMVH